MNRLMSRHFGVVKFLGIGLVTFFAGSALTTHFTTKLLLDVSSIAEASESDESDPEFDPEQEDAEEAEAKALAAQQMNDKALAGMAGKGTRKQQTADGIVGANIFCPTCIPIGDQPIEPVLLADGSMQVGEVQSALPLLLLATMESDDPLWSMATIQDTENNRLGPFTANESIRPGVTILAVERGKVILLNNGRREFITAGVVPVAKPVAAAKPGAESKPDAKPGKSVAIEGADEAVDCANENSCTVDRAFVDKMLANPTQLMTQAKMFPVTKDGETAGFRVSGIKTGSLATMIGLKNGDVVSEINGAKLGNIDDALAMYQKLRRASHLSVTVERAGAVISKEISIK
jgi:type II secretion system protein C